MVIGEAAEPVRRSVHPDNAERVGEPDDAVLVAAAREHPQAFAALYDRYIDRVFAYCFRRLSHPETAADATSQVFTNAIQAFPGFRIDRRRAGSSFRS